MLATLSSYAHGAHAQSLARCFFLGTLQAFLFSQPFRHALPLRSALTYLAFVLVYVHICTHFRWEMACRTTRRRTNSMTISQRNDRNFQLGGRSRWLRMDMEHGNAVTLWKNIRTLRNRRARACSARGFAFFHRASSTRLSASVQLYLRPTVPPSNCTFQ